MNKYCVPIRISWDYEISDTQEIDALLSEYEKK